MRTAARRDAVTDAGAGTVLVVAVAGLLLTIGVALGVVAALVVDHRKAQSAADLASLAGAGALARGGDPCGQARRVAAANGAAVVSCATRGLDVLGEGVLPGPRWWGWSGDLRARARAGPAGPVPGG